MKQCKNMKFRPKSDFLRQFISLDNCSYMKEIPGHIIEFKMYNKKGICPLYKICKHYKA